MLFGFLHRVAIVVIDLKETIIFIVLHSYQICRRNVFLSSGMRTPTLGIHQWQDHSPWSVLLTLQHLPPLPLLQQKLLGQSWLLLVPRFLFQLPPQLRSLLLDFPVSFLGVLFTQQGKEPMFQPKELGLNPPPPQKTQKLLASKAVAKVIWIGGGRGVKNLLLLWLFPPL